MILIHMPYDHDITSGSLDVQLKRRTWRMDIERPNATGNASLFANCFMQEDLIDVTPGSPTSGSAISHTNWLININKDQILDRNNAASFFNSMLNYINGLKTEYDASGSLATGSIQQLSN
jgi:hypothetical protein